MLLVLRQVTCSSTASSQRTPLLDEPCRRPEQLQPARYVGHTLYVAGLYSAMSTHGFHSISSVPCIATQKLIGLSLLQGVGYHYIVAWCHDMPSRIAQQPLPASSASLVLLSTKPRFLMQLPDRSSWQLKGTLSAVQVAAAAVETLQQISGQVRAPICQCPLYASCNPN